MLPSLRNFDLASMVYGHTTLNVPDLVWFGWYGVGLKYATTGGQWVEWQYGANQLLLSAFQIQALKKKKTLYFFVCVKF